jgi:hypothetical protein
VQAQFLCNQQVAQIETHQVQAQNPDFQRLMMAFKDTFSQVIKPLGAGVTVIPLSLFLSSVLASFRHLSRPTLGTVYTGRPPQVAYFDIASFIIDQVLDLEHRLALFICRFRSAYGSTSPFANQLNSLESLSSLNVLGRVETT